jgi:hypothetical protein
LIAAWGILLMVYLLAEAGVYLEFTFFFLTLVFSPLAAVGLALVIAGIIALIKKPKATS